MTVSPIRSLSVLAAIAVCASPASASSYFIQPMVTYGVGGFINGLVQNGPTSGWQGYNNAPTAINTWVDLEAGTIKGSVDLSYPNQIGFSQGRLGEEVTVWGGQGQATTFQFAVEGDYFVGARLPELNSNQYAAVEAYISVFDASVGANASNWYDLTFSSGLALGYDRFDLNMSGTLDDLWGSVNEVLSVSVQNTSNIARYDVFAHLGLIGITNDNPINISFDFSHTATFGILTEGGSYFTSSSGVFLGSELTPSVAPVPLPASLPFLLAGLSGLALVRTRRHR